MTRIEAALLVPPPLSGAGLIYYDDFSASPAGGRQMINFPIRDVAAYASAAIAVPAGGAMPSALAENGLNQAMTVAWELSWNESVWVPGDAGTNVPTLAKVVIPPNSRPAPFVRLKATAALNPISGSAVVSALVRIPPWVQSGGSDNGEVVNLVQGRKEALTGGIVSELRTRARGAAIGDEATLTKDLSIPQVPPVLELGALISLAFPSVSPRIQLGWDELITGLSGQMFVLRHEGDAAGTVYITTTVGTVSIGARKRYTDSAWLDFRVLVAPAQGRWVGAAINGELFGGGGIEGSATGAPGGLLSNGKAQLKVRAMTAAQTGLLIDRVWVRGLG